MKPQSTEHITTACNTGQSDALLMLSCGYYRIFVCCKECLIRKRHECSKTASDLKLYCVCVCVCLCVRERVLRCPVFLHFQYI
jgi:hypothetical protein